MKKKTTRKATMKKFDKIISVGYCNLQNLLYLKDPESYWCGELGWYCDIYNVNGVAITTGYQPFGNYNADITVCELFESRAREIFKEIRDYETQSKMIDNLIADFVGTVIGGA